MLEEFKWGSICINMERLTNKGFNGVVVNRALPSLPAEAHTYRALK